VPDELTQQPGTVRVTVAEEGRGRGLLSRLGRPGLLARIGRVGLLIVVALVASAGVLVGYRVLAGPADGDAPRTTVPVSSLDARAVAPVPGSSRLVLLGQQPLLDTRLTGALAPGGEADLPLPALPAGSRAVLVDVSLVQATGPGAVALVSAAGEVTALQLARAGAQSSATVVVPISGDNRLRVRTQGGGHAIVSLVGAFEPAETATAGRIVPIPTTRVLRLVPKTDGKDARIDLASVSALAEAASPGGGSAAAVLLQIAADVGTHGGFVIVDGAADRPDQQIFWSATAGTDRTRTGFAVVPLTGSAVRIHYEAGSLITVDLVGYVTAASAPASAAGLVVPLTPTAPVGPTPVAAGGSAVVKVVPLPDTDQPPADRVGAVLLRLSAIGDRIGVVAVQPADATGQPEPYLTAAPGVSRSAQTLVRTVDGAVRVSSAAGASVTLIPQAAILSG